MTANMIATATPTDTILGYYDGDKPICLETFQELFLEVRKLKAENKRLAKRLKSYEPDEDEIITE